MKKFAVPVLLLAIVLFTFGYWGYFTQSGQSAFDEMNGMIPFFALIGSGVLGLIVVILIIIGRIKK